MYVSIIPDNDRPRFFAMALRASAIGSGQRRFRRVMPVGYADVCQRAIPCAKFVRALSFGDGGTVKRTRVYPLPPIAEVQRQRKVARMKARRREKVHAATRERNRLIREDATAKGINPALVNQWADIDAMFNNLKAFALMLWGGNRLERKRARRKQGAPYWQTFNGVDQMITSKTAYEVLYAAAHGTD